MQFESSLPTVQRIVIMRALFLGDLLMTVPAWRALRRRFPRAEITLISLPWAECLLDHLPGLLDRFEPFPGWEGIAEVPFEPARTAAFLAEQQARRYDLALQMHGNGRASNGFVAALGARRTVGYACSGDERLDLGLAHTPEQNEVERWLQLAEALGAPAHGTHAEFALGPAHYASADALLGELVSDGPLIGLHTGAKEPARRWPLESFATLANQLHNRLGATVVLTGTAGEQAATAQLRQMLRGPALDLAGRTALGSFAALLGRLDLLVTNDTGASHLAAAMGVPSVVLFGPSRPAQFAPPDGALHRVLDALELVQANDPAAALRRLPVEVVLAACLAQLARQRGAATQAAVLAHALGSEEQICAA